MNQGDIERQENCKTYFFLAKKRTMGLRSGFDNQFFASGLREIWSAFDAFLGFKHPMNDNKTMQKEYSKKYQGLFEVWNMSDKFKNSIKKLKDLSLVEDNSPINPRKDVSLEDINSLVQILEISYRVRSNLDHGSKDLERQDEIGVRNRELVEHSFNVTYEIYEKTLINEKLI